MSEQGYLFASILLSGLPTFAMIVIAAWVNQLSRNASNWDRVMLWSMLLCWFGVTISYFVVSMASRYEFFERTLPLVFVIVPISIQIFASLGIGAIATKFFLELKSREKS